MAYPANADQHNIDPSLLFQDSQEPLTTPLFVIIIKLFNELFQSAPHSQPPKSTTNLIVILSTRPIFPLLGSQAPEGPHHVIRIAHEIALLESAVVVHLELLDDWFQISNDLLGLLARRLGVLKVESVTEES